MQKQFVLLVGMLTMTIACCSLARAQPANEPASFGPLRMDIGVTQLRLDNPGLTEGVGIQAELVEAGFQGDDRYVPNPEDVRISSNSINIVGMAQNAELSETTSGHALGSAVFFFGTSGIARDLGTGGLSIDSYIISRNDEPTDNTPTVDWVNAVIFNGGGDPELSGFDRQTVSSHSYAFFSDPNGQLPSLMERMDYIIDQSDATIVVGSNNGGALPPGWAPNYNALTVGVSSGNHGSGLTTTYGAGRVAIDVVAPTTATSTATPFVAGAVAILQDAANDTDAANSEVIRATIMAGATKDESEFTAGWARTTTEPLDSVLGAGELNVHNSYDIQQAGEFDGGSATSPVMIAATNGWDYDSGISTNGERIYEFEIDGGEELTDFSVALTWNLDIVDNGLSQFVWSPTQQLANLSLELYDSTDSYLGTLLDESVSDVDNVEHIYVISGLTKGTYHLRVSNNNDFATDYGFAWRGTVVPLLGDANGDGKVDNQDIMPFATALFNSAMYQSMYPNLDPDVILDMNGSGEFNNLDIMGFSSALGF